MRQVDEIIQNQLELKKGPISIILEEYTKHQNTIQQNRKHAASWHRNNSAEHTDGCVPVQMLWGWSRISA